MMVLSTSSLVLLFALHLQVAFAFTSSGLSATESYFNPLHKRRHRYHAERALSSNGKRAWYTTTSIGSSIDDSNDTTNPDTASKRIYFDIAIPTPAEEIPVGRLTFILTPENHPHYLPLHISNLISLASSSRRAVDAKATYEGCIFQYSPTASIDDGSFRYRWGHVCDGFGRNGIQVVDAEGRKTGWDEPFTDTERLKECSHSCFGGVYYGWQYDEIVDILINKGEEAAILLTVPIRGPGAGTSKFSIVRVSESPQEWGERLLLNSAVVGYLDCSADGTFGNDSGDDDSAEEGNTTALDVLRAMARQRMGPPKIVKSGVV